MQPENLKDAEFWLTNFLRVLQVAGGAGGVMYWIDLYRKRPRVIVRKYREVIDDRLNRWTIQLEVENIGNGPTSYLSNGFIQARCRFDLRDRVESGLQAPAEADRTLQPFTPTWITLEATKEDVGALLGFSWFREITLPLSRGSAAKGRMLNAGDKVGMGWVRFYFGRWIMPYRFRWLNWKEKRLRRRREAEAQAQLKASEAAGKLPTNPSAPAPPSGPAPDS